VKDLTRWTTDLSLLVWRTDGAILWNESCMAYGILTSLSYDFSEMVNIKPNYEIIALYQINHQLSVGKIKSGYTMSCLE